MCGLGEVPGLQQRKTSYALPTPALQVKGIEIQGAFPFEFLPLLVTLACHSWSLAFISLSVNGHFYSFPSLED